MQLPELLDVDHDWCANQHRDTVVTVRVQIPKGAGNMSPAALQGCASSFRNHISDFMSGHKIWPWDESEVPHGR